MANNAIILREDLSGFIFESNKGTKHSFTAETSLGMRKKYSSIILYVSYFFLSENVYKTLHYIIFITLHYIIYII